MGVLSGNGWKQIVQQKRDARAAAVQAGLKAAGPATPEDESYLAATACDIVDGIVSGRWKSGQVVRAYIRRAALLHERFNCLTEVRFVEAIEEADALDSTFAASNTPRGRLHGVPLSAKEQFDVTGYDSSIGYTSWANKPAKEDAGLVNLLRAEGAILIAKTNLPQTVAFIESVNPIFGRTSNPWNDKYIPGGSSGGEAALLAGDGSALGIGTDQAGSLRNPAFWCGLFSFKPTAARISCAGLADSIPGYSSLALVPGPMGRSLDDIERIARIALGRTPYAWEDLAPIPYRDNVVESSARLRFGYYTYDGYIRSSPVSERAVLETVAALRAAGHEVIEFMPPRINHAFELVAGFISADGYETMLGPLKDDPAEKELFLTTLGPSLPGFVRGLIGWASRTFYDDEDFGHVIGAARKKSVAELYQLNVQRQEYIKLFHEQVWAKYGFDGIIAPPGATPAPPHGSTTMIPSISAAFAVYNVLDVPVGVVPVTHVDPAKDAVTPEWLAQDPVGKRHRMVEKTLFHDAKPLYDAEAMKGLPLGVQVVGRQWEDEKVFHMMRIVDNALGKRRVGPGLWKP